MTKQHKFTLSTIGLVLLLPVTVQATDGYQLIGVGSYQKSLGGAITANPGSAMTSVSNPAGAARIESRADFSMETLLSETSFGANIGYRF